MMRSKPISTLRGQMNKYTTNMMHLDNSIIIHKGFFDGITSEELDLNTRKIKRIIDLRRNSPQWLRKKLEQIETLLKLNHKNVSNNYFIKELEINAVNGDNKTTFGPWNISHERKDIIENGKFSNTYDLLMEMKTESRKISQLRKFIKDTSVEELSKIGKLDSNGTILELDASLVTY